MRASATGDKEIYFSCNFPISAFVQLLLGQEHLLAKWHNQKHLGIGCVCSCPLHCQPNARNRSWKPSSGQSVCINRFPRNKWLFFGTIHTDYVLWPSPLEMDLGVFCQRAAGQSSSSSTPRREAGRADRDVRLERNQDLNSNMEEQLLPRRERAALCGEGRGACLFCMCSLCSPGGMEHRSFLLHQSQF